MVLSFDSQRRLSKEKSYFDTFMTEFTYPSDTEIIIETTYDSYNFTPYDHIVFEFLADGTGKETFYYEEQAVGYRIYEYDNG